jgi:ABC-type microcin C transport system permease subunit YejB
MPLFNWDGGDIPVIKKGFKYYWAIAIPLTVLVLLIWAAAMLLPWTRWIAGIRRQMKKDDLEAGNMERYKDE